MIRLFSARICPFAQRTRALLCLLGEDFELCEVDLEDRDPELLERSPTGRVPFLEEDGFRLYESAVIDDYLAESRSWSRAYADDPRTRALQRVAMKQWDDVVLPAFYDSLRDEAALDDRRRQQVGREIDQLAATVTRPEVRPESLLGLHVAPFWARMWWLRRHTPLPAMVDERARLRRWLDDAVALPAVQETLPDRDWAVELYEQRYVGERAQAATSAPG